MSEMNWGVIYQVSLTTADRTSEFIESFYANSSFERWLGNSYLNYSINVIYNKRGNPRNGDGSSEFFYTPDDTIEFLTNSVGKEVFFIQQYITYTIDPNFTTIDRQQWADASAKITSVTVSAVPEPSTMLLALMGLGLIGLARKKI